jgi:hypothetical protein
MIMRKITKLLVCLSCVALLAVACEKEETPNPFEGGDNHITSFVLKKGDVSYTAAIAADTITVTIPENVSLEGFTTEYRLSENAEINPKPKEITDWNSEQQFVVTAYNGAKATYFYTVKRRFEGGDNHITSFVLKKDDVSYIAAIAADSITVTIPENVSLEGFTAEYHLCENAEINPKPEEVTDWESEQQFTVTAYNGTEATYFYTVKRLAVGLTHDGAVILNTQEEVNGFGTLGYTAIDGYLTIGATSGTNTITSLEPLAGLKNVTGTLLINATYQGALDAFTELEAVGELNVFSKEVTAISFPKLKAVRTSMNFDQLVDATGHVPPIQITSLDFPELTTIDRSLRIYYADELTAMNFPKLERVREDLVMEGHGTQSIGNINTITFPTLINVGGAISLTRVYTATFAAPELKTAGTFTINLCDRLGTITLPELETLDDLSITKANITIRPEALTKLQLPALTTVKTMNLNIPDAYTFQLTLSALRDVKTLNLDFWRSTAFTLSAPVLEEVETLFFRSGTNFEDQYGNYGGVTSLDLSALVLKKVETLTLDLIDVTSLTLPTLLEQVGTLTLNVPEITTLSLPAALKKVGTLDLSSDVITHFTLPASLEELGTLKLTLPNLTEIDLPESLKEVGTLSLSLPGVTAFALPASLENMGTLTLTVADATTFDLSATQGKVELLTLDFPKAATFTMDMGTLDVETLKLALPEVIELAPVLKTSTFSAHNLVKLKRLDVTGITGVSTLEITGTTLSYNDGPLKLVGPATFPGKLLFDASSGGVSLYAGDTLVSVEEGCFEEVGSLDFGVSNTDNGLSAIYLPWLKRVTGMVTVGNATYLTYFSLPNLQSVGGLTIIDGDLNQTYPALTFDLSKLETVTASGISLCGRRLRTLTRLELPELTSVEGDISITGFYDDRYDYGSNNKIQTISFPKLESITGMLAITTMSANNNVGTLTTFEFDRLTSVVGGVTISRFTALKNFCPLAGVINSFAANKWSVTGCGYNPTYQDMVDNKCSN